MSRIHNIRKMTWALLAWTAFFVLLINLGLSNAAGTVCTGMSTDSATLCQGGMVIIGGVTAIFLWFVWLIGMVVLSFAWFATRPKPETPVHGPAGQQMIVTAAEARRLVETQGWTYDAPWQNPPPPAAPRPQ